MKRLKLTLNFLLILFVCPPVAAGSQKGEISSPDIYSQSAAVQQKMGDPAAAVMRRLQGIESDVFNEEKWQDLSRLLSETEDMHPFGGRLNRVVRIQEYIVFLIERLKYYQQSNAELEEKLHLLTDFDMKRGVENVQSGRLTFSPADWDSLDVHDPLFWDDVLLTLDHIKKHITARLTAATDRSARLRQRKLAFIQESRRLENRDIVQQLSSRLDRLQTKLLSKERTVTRQNDRIAQLSENVDKLALSLKVMRDKIQFSNERAERTTRELADVSLQLYQKEGQLVDKQQQIASLDEDLEEVHQRLALVQKIISDKDEHIRSLEDQIAGLKESWTSREQNADMEFNMMRGRLIRIEEQSKQQQNDYEKRIGLLEDQVAVLRSRNTAISSSLRDKEQQIALIRIDNQRKEKSISEAEILLMSKDRKLVELQGVLRVYREKLADLTARLSGAELEQQRLRQQLFGKQKNGKSGVPESINSRITLDQQARNRLIELLTRPVISPNKSTR
ncbi:MAG: hypothetical protein ACLFPX_01720 [Candidatus Omnitrophota bacterium]